MYLQTKTEKKKPWFYETGNSYLQTTYVFGVERITIPRDKTSNK